MNTRFTFGIILMGFGLVMAASLPNWPWAMHGDQILFLQGAESLDRGELLYRDFWDLKQPGIIVFYYLGGLFFQFSEWGIHLAEAIYWLGVGFLLMWAWPQTLGVGRCSVWPVITIPVWYYAVTGSMQHTQVETLIGPFLFLHWWLLWRCSDLDGPNQGNWLLAGGIAAVVLLFKFMFLPLLGLGFLHAWYTQQQRHGWRVTLQPLLIYLGSGGLLLGFSFWPWVWNYEKGELWRTFIVYPQQMMRELPEVSHKRLLDSIRWFGIRFGPLFVLSLLGALSLWRLGQRSLLVFLGAWMGVSVGLIYAQKQSWWSYHFMLLLVPLGLLAAEGCRMLADGIRWQRNLKLQRAILLMLLAPAAIALIMKWSIWAKYDFAWYESARQQYYCGEDPHYQEATAETAFLHEPTSLTGPIFVCGEPVYYRLANRLPATSVHGWSMELYVGPVRQRLTDELQQSDCAYVFLNSYQNHMVAERYPELMAWLQSKFQVKQQSNAGTWYERRSP